ncbi:hypothetical protein B0T21DRAFT_289126, partial [Apiosordaria backusii]
TISLAIILTIRAPVTMTSTSTSTSTSKVTTTSTISTSTTSTSLRVTTIFITSTSTTAPIVNSGNIEFIGLIAYTVGTYAIYNPYYAQVSDPISPSLFT